MALVTFSGYPASGKSTRAQELSRFLTQRLGEESTNGTLRRLKVVVINDESLFLSKSAYDESRLEKPARATLFSAVIRVLNKETIVIVDGMNYIKGSRYQMYCAAREVGARVCTVHIATPPEKCKEWNLLRGERYAEATIDNLISRFEEPASGARWDSPLITIPFVDGPLDSRNEEGVLCSVDAARIWDAVVKGEIKPPNVATLVAATSTTTYLTLLESTTSLLLTTILQTQQTISPSPLSSTTLLLSTTPPVRLEISLNKVLSMAMGQRLKKQFTKLNMQAGSAGGGKELGVESIARLFGEYLEGAVR